MSGKWQIVHTNWGDQPVILRWVAGNNETVLHSETYTEVAGAENALLSVAEGHGLADPSIHSYPHKDGLKYVVASNGFAGPNVEYVDEREERPDMEAKKMTPAEDIGPGINASDEEDEPDFEPPAVEHLQYKPVKDEYSASKKARLIAYALLEPGHSDLAWTEEQKLDRLELAAWWANYAVRAKARELEVEAAVTETPVPV